MQLSPVGQNELKWFACWHWMEKGPKEHGQKCTASALTHLSVCSCLHCSGEKPTRNISALSISEITEVTKSPGWSTVTYQFYPKLVPNSWIITGNPAHIVVHGQCPTNICGPGSAHLGPSGGAFVQSKLMRVVVMPYWTQTWEVLWLNRLYV